MISNSFSAKSGLLDSNQRPRAPQTCALPTALNPDLFVVRCAKVKSFDDICKFISLFFIYFSYLMRFRSNLFCRAGFIY